MLDSVKDFINRLSTGESNASYSDEEIAQAVASLFKQMVRADGVEKPEEIAASLKSLATDYGKDGTKASEYFSTVEEEPLFAIAAIINRSMSLQERAELKLRLVSIAMSDREFHPYEQDFMDMVNRMIKG